ncbi:MAG: pyruvate, phosphate dikinase, partial [Candidatus Cloacimonadota bacterium]
SNAIKEAVVLAKGLPASPGAATGQLVFFADEANKFGNAILARIETSPEDLEGMNIANGILTARGGMTSHAAVVARGMGKCCVSGAGSVRINYKERIMVLEGKTYKEGDWVSLNGSTGEVYEGKIATIDPELSGDFGKLMELADKFTCMYVRTNADTPNDAKVAREFGAKGIGLCRTEHMFFEGEKIKAMREMILADDEAGRRKALAKLLPFQRTDFEGIFKEMTGFGVTVRLLDPPLHEFVPHETANQQEMADEMGIPVEEVKVKVDSLHEFNPMLGHRGCRLGNTYPEITEMQARAIIEAAINVKEVGFDPKPEIMVPLIGTVEEYRLQAAIINETAKKVFEETGKTVEYLVGTMIEIPRAALTADLIGKEAEFFSFGTNDLTQMAFGYSRDDAGKFLPIYLEKGILKDDPFQVLDQEGVGQLVQMATEKGRSVNADLKVGICGEHGGEPKSVKFCNSVGMDYVSCSPYRVPIARLAAAQAAIEQN